MIIDVFNQVYSKLKTDITLDGSSVLVLPDFPDISPQLPCVIIESKNNSNRLDTTSSAGQQHNTCVYEINVFTQGDTKRTDSVNIVGQVDSIMSDEFGMNRDSMEQVRNLFDETIYRIVIRYTFTIDKQQKIHRR